MKNLQKSFKSLFLLLVVSIFFTSCQELNSKMEEQLDNLNERTEELDSAVNRGLDRVENLDSTINAKTKKIKNLDSLVRKTTSRIDSIVTKNTDEINRQLN